jgi:putative inorganic carbon (HCO3(-)) transporter
LDACDLRGDRGVWYEANVVEGRPRRWLAAWLLAALIGAYLSLAPDAFATGALVTAPPEPVTSVRQANPQLIAFLQSPAGVALEAAALVIATLGWTIGVVRWLERAEGPSRALASRTSRKRARRRDASSARPTTETRITWILSGLVSAAGLILPVTFSVVIPDDVFAFPKTVALWLFALAIGACMVALFLAGARPSRPRLLELSAIAYIALTALATVVASDPVFSLLGERSQYQGLLSSVAYMALFAGAVVALTTPARVRVMAIAVLASSTAAAVYALVQWFSLDPIFAELYKGRVFSTVGQANALATTLAAGVVVSLALAVVHRRAARLAIAGCIVLCLAALVVTFSRGGYVALVVGLAVALIVVIPGIRRSVNRKWARRLVGATAAGLLVVGLIAVAWRPAGELVERVAARTTSIADANEGSNRSHLDLWTVGLRIAIDHPALGTGPDSYATVFPSYRDAVLSSDSAEKLARFRPESPHNVYLAIAAGAGFPALAAFVVLIGSCFALGIRAVRQSSVAVRLALAGLLGALTVHLVTIVFMTAEPATFALFWILLGALAGLGRGLRATATEPPQSDPG